MIVYLDTSVVLRVLFGQAPRWRGWSAWDTAWSSELMGVEARRAIDRFRLQAALDDRGVAEAQQLFMTKRGQSTLAPIPRDEKSSQGSIISEGTE